MTTALHLAPLVAAGLVRGPIDVYESTSVKKVDGRSRDSGHTPRGVESAGGGRQLHPGSGALGRDIGVGIWSTGWWPFLRSVKEGMLPPSSTDGGGGGEAMQDSIRTEKNRRSYRILLQDLEACGSYVRDVGYRTPNGSWLVKSELNPSPFGIQDLLADESGDGFEKMCIVDEDPALLFVREKDLLSCLRNAVGIEGKLGTVKLHSGVRVDGITNVVGDLGSLVLQSTAGESDAYDSPQYHVIVAADGLYSTLRSRFAGHHSSQVTGTGMESSTRPPSKDTLEYQWEHTKGQREATQVESREYVVFRGNAPKLLDVEDGEEQAFQSWGEERGMRFAAVPFRHETEDLDDGDDCGGDGHYSQSQSFMSKKKEEEVWFATISDPAFIDTFRDASAWWDADYDAEGQKKLLLEAFGSWHKPVRTLIETTPADKIMCDLAVAHRHNARPVFDVARIMEFEMWQENRMAKKNESGGLTEPQQERQHSGDVCILGRGPVVTFIGDSMMCIDPVLAQGFTVAMESGASFAARIQQVLVHPDAATSRTQLLREVLLERYYVRERRILKLLRSTELVQRMAQPHGVGALFATWIVRPLIRLCPSGVKKRVFDYMIRYSLGLTGDRDKY